MNHRTSPLRLIGNYFFWSYERGSFHYDIMVTAILLFIFVGPRFIDFKDKPVLTPPLRSSEVLVTRHATQDGHTRLTYQVRAEDLGPARTDAERRAALIRIIEPISGDVALTHYEPVLDTHGNTIAFNAVVEH